MLTKVHGSYQHSSKLMLTCKNQSCIFSFLCGREEAGIRLRLGLEKSNLSAVQIIVPLRHFQQGVIGYGTNPRGINLGQLLVSLYIIFGVHEPKFTPKKDFKKI